MLLLLPMCLCADLHTFLALPVRVQRLAEEVRGELAAARAANAAAQQDALQKVAGAAADAAAAAQRAAMAEAEAGRLRTEVARLQQESKVFVVLVGVCDAARPT